LRKEKEPNEKRVGFYVRVHPDVLSNFKAQCALRTATMQDVCDKLIEGFLNGTISVNIEKKKQQ